MRKEVLLRAKEERNILHTLKRRKTNWIGHIAAQGLASKNTLLKGRAKVG
jgi:hypothetical protein